MAKSKKANSYIQYELEVLEKKARELNDYVTARPFDKLKDRITGGKIAATEEAQLKALTTALKDYAEIVMVIDKLREKEEQKQINVRGDQTLSPFESGDID